MILLYFLTLSSRIASDSTLVVNLGLVKWRNARLLTKDICWVPWVPSPANGTRLVPPVILWTVTRGFKPMDSMKRIRLKIRDVWGLYQSPGKVVWSAGTPAPDGMLSPFGAGGTRAYTGGGVWAMMHWGTLRKTSQGKSEDVLEEDLHLSQGMSLDLKNMSGLGEW